MESHSSWGSYTICKKIIFCYCDMRLVWIVIQHLIFIENFFGWFWLICVWLPTQTFLYVWRIWLSTVKDIEFTDMLKKKMENPHEKHLVRWLNYWMICLSIDLLSNYPGSGNQIPLWSGLRLHLITVVSLLTALPGLCLMSTVKGLDTLCSVLFTLLYLVDLGWPWSNSSPTQWALHPEQWHMK